MSVKPPTLLPLFIIIVPKRPTVRPRTIRCAIQVGRACAYAVEERDGRVHRHVIGVSAFPSSTGARVAQLGRIHEQLKATYPYRHGLIDWNRVLKLFDAYLNRRR